MSDRLVQYIVEASDAVANRFAEKIELASRRCESPIEALLMAALVSADEQQPINLFHFMGSGELPETLPFGGVAFIYPQAKIGKYRADFAIVDATTSKSGEKWRVMIVECDGHDFHERTKEQARRDKSRDRYFQSLGHKVLHFTGSEIWADPDACAGEVVSQLAFEDEWRVRP